MPAIRLEVGIPIEEVEVALPTSVDVEAIKMALGVAPLTLPTFAEGEEVLVAELPVLALLAEAAIIEVTKKDGPIAACLSVIEAMADALLATTKLLTGEMARGIVGEAVREVIANTCKVAKIPAVASPEAGCLAGIFPVVTVGYFLVLVGKTVFVK